MADQWAERFASDKLEEGTKLFVLSFKSRMKPFLIIDFINDYIHCFLQFSGSNSAEISFRANLLQLVETRGYQSNSHAHTCIQRVTFCKNQSKSVTIKFDLRLQRGIPLHIM